MILLYTHIALMASAFSVLAAGVVIAKFFKSRKWWLKTHRTLNIAGVLLAVSAFLAAAVMVGQSGGPHFRVPHAVVGGIILLLLLGTPALGYTIFKSKGKEKIAGLKMLHRWSGRITLTGMLAAATLGFLLIGLF